MKERVMPKTTLTKIEFYRALSVASKRACDVFTNNRKDNKKTPDKYWVENHLLGTLCEAAYAKLMGIKFDPDTKIGSRDFPNAEIRGTKYSNGKLLMDIDNDLDDTPYFLMVHLYDHTYGLAGGMMGRQAKDMKYWDETLPRPSIAVPQNKLDIFPVIPMKFNPLDDFL